MRGSEKPAQGQGGYTLSFARVDGTLRATVTGERSLENTVAYWQSIVAEIVAKRPTWLFLCDQLKGPEMSVDEWRKLVDRMKGRGLEGLRIAHVKPHGRDHIEYCEIFAREAGIDARAFDDAGTAERWLRYGVEEERAD
jgi:hypothetical protein